MNRVHIIQFGPRHSHVGMLYIIEQILPHTTLDTHPNQLIEFLKDGEEFRTWCWERHIPIHGKKFAHALKECEYVDLTEDQRFEFKMRWGY
jgi:hypothetical protein